MEEFSRSSQGQSLGPTEVDRIMEELTAPPAVDSEQVPMHHRPHADAPELDLHRAILFDAVHCAVKHYHSRLRSQNLEAQSAMRWISSNDDKYFLSFVQVCHRFALDPNWIRRLVHTHIRREALEGIAA